MTIKASVENPFVKLGRSELITTVSIFLFRLKFPETFNQTFHEFFGGEIPAEFQIIIIFTLGLTTGLLINLATESSEIFLINLFFGKTLDENNITNLINDFKKSKKYSKYKHYFFWDENFYIFYSLVLTFGNRFSKICDTTLAENRYRHSAYFIVYGFILIFNLILLIIPPNYSPLIIFSAIGCIIGILFLFSSSYISFTRLIRLMYTVLEELKRTNNIFECSRDEI